MLSRKYQNNVSRFAFFQGSLPRSSTRSTPYISGFLLENWRFSAKPNTQDCVRCRGPKSGFPGSFFQPCNVPRRTKGFAFGLVKSKGLREKSFRFGGHGVTRPTVSFDLLLHTIPNIQCIPCIQWFNSPISTRSTRLKSLTRNNSKLTFRPTAGSEQA